MIFYISKNKNGDYIATTKTIESAKLIDGTHTVIKVETDTIVDQGFMDLIALLGIPPKWIVESILTNRIAERTADRANWQPDIDYGDGSWVTYRGRRCWATGIGQIPSSRGA